MNANDVKKSVRDLKDSAKAKIMQGFFKTGKGEYGEGDIFLGLTVPQSRTVAKRYKGLPLGEVSKLLHSPFHEERLIALLILVEQFSKADEGTRRKIYEFYLKNTKYINNWDLVDLSADKIVGAYLSDKPRGVLYKLAKSKSLWERRIAVLATFYFIKNNEFSETLKIAKVLVRDEPILQAQGGHDLIHKAVGWMLREIGKRSLSTEEKFLKEHYKEMPRTMLRYAIERFPEAKRQRYLKGKI